MKPKVLVLGANGMLGGSIHRYFTKSNKYDVTGTVRSVESKNNLYKMGFKNIESNIDGSNDESLQFIFDRVKPNFVINCIGIIKQLKEAKDPIHSIQTNSLLPHKLASYSTKHNAKLIHFSTDCVFSGKRGNYTEEDTPDEVDIYGRSKLLGEVDYDNHLTFRTSIIGHEISSNISLVDWFLSQSGRVRGFSKAIFSGLPTIKVAEILDKLIADCPGLSGLYHLSAQPINKYDLLHKIKNQYKLDIEIDEDTSVFIDKSLRSDLLKMKFEELVIEEWSVLVSKMHKEYIDYFRQR